MKKKNTDITLRLISDEEFKDWVLNPKPTSDKFWKRWISEHLENIDEIQTAKEFVERIKFKEQMLDADESDELLGAILRQEKMYLQRKAKTKHVYFSFKGQYIQVASILLIILSISVLINFITSEEEQLSEKIKLVEWHETKNPRGRKSSIILPDGTKVTLNYESRLKFPKEFHENKRQVELVGEAFFEVTPNDTLPFIVRTGDILTEVLGTSFNITSFEWDDSTDISLVTGKVNVKSGSSDSSGYASEVTLKPGEQFTYNKFSKESNITHFDIENIVGWKNGIILFNNASFEDFIDKLEKWYGVSFQVFGNPSRTWNINGRYENQMLDDILVGLKFVYDIEYQINGKNVTLKIR